MVQRLTALQHKQHSSHTDIPLADVTVDAVLPYSDGCFYANGVHAGCAASCPVQTVHAVGTRTVCDGTWQAANSELIYCPVTTLGKLFTPMCLCRSQWSSDGMIDCGVRGCGQLCLSRQPLRCTALGTGCAPFLHCLGRLSLPPSMGR